MRILMSADAVGGVWTYALALARGLERSGARVTLAVMGGALSRERRAEAADRRGLTLVESDYRLEWMPDARADVAAAGEWLLDLERRVRPDVVHLNGYAHAALPWSAPTLVVAHSCVCSWWHAVHGCAAPTHWQPYREAVAAGLRAARLVVAPTQAMLDALIEQYGVPETGRVIPNGCEPAPLPLGVRDAFGRYPPRHRPQQIVLAAGRAWDEAKNLQTLAAAAPDIRWPVFIAGAADRPHGEPVQLPGVTMLGHLNVVDMQRWLRRAPIFVHPALYEPFGLAPLEAAHAGAALVLGDIPSLREVWGDAALYVPPREPAAMAAAVNRLIANPRLLARLAAAARGRASRYGIAAMTRAYDETYRQLVSGSVTAREEALACAS